MILMRDLFAASVRKNQLLSSACKWVTLKESFCTDQNH
jgi:hypothetical protein